MPLAARSIGWGTSLNGLTEEEIGIMVQDILSLRQERVVKGRPGEVAQLHPMPPEPP